MGAAYEEAEGPGGASCEEEEAALDPLEDPWGAPCGEAPGVHAGLVARGDQEAHEVLAARVAHVALAGHEAWVARVVQEVRVAPGP